MDEKNELLQAALSYAAHGWAVLPLRPGSKVPMFKEWQHKASTDPEKIKKWWTQNPRANIGIATGAISGGLLVIDVDDKPAEGKHKAKHGRQTLKDWENENGNLPETLRARTASGGLHLYYQCPAGLVIDSRTNVHPFIDLRAGSPEKSAGQIVAPPSQVKGRRYEWETPGASIAEVNDTVLQFIGRAAETADDPEDLKFPDTEAKTFTAPAEIPEGKRTGTLVAMIGSMKARGYNLKTIEAAVRAANETTCTPPLSEQELQKEVFPALKRWKPGPPEYLKKSAAVPPELVEKLKALNAAENYERNDKGAGRLFADIFADRHRYCPSWGRNGKGWAYYDGARWVRDPEGLHARESAKLLSDALMMYAPAAGLDDVMTVNYRKYCAGMGAMGVRDKMIKDSESEKPFTAGDLDREPLFLNCENGVLDFRDRGRVRLIEHSPELLLSKLAPVSYDPEARCDTWKKYIDEIMQGNAAKIGFLQRFAGLCLTGLTREETMLILYGSTTRNGKSTFVETFRSLMGDYAVAIPPETLAYRKRDSRSASPDIASLVGARLVTSSEPRKGMVFDSANLKTMIGRDTLAARELYGDMFNFRPAFKLLMNANYEPIINDETLIASGRINVLTFDRHFKDEEQDRDLMDKLAKPAELSGILNWCIEGLEDYFRHGLQPPAEVREAVEEYRKENDRIGNFMDECLEPDAAGAVSGTEVFGRYKGWCTENGSQYEAKTRFFAELRRRGLLQKNATINGQHKKNVMTGYKLRREGLGADDD